IPLWLFRRGGLDGSGRFGVRLSGLPCGFAPSGLPLQRVGNQAIDFAEIVAGLPVAGPTGINEVDNRLKASEAVRRLAQVKLSSLNTAKHSPQSSMVTAGKCPSTDRLLNEDAHGVR